MKNKYTYVKISWGRNEIFCWDKDTEIGYWVNNSEEFNLYRLNKFKTLQISTRNLEWVLKYRKVEIFTLQQVLKHYKIPKWKINWNKRN